MIAAIGTAAIQLATAGFALGLSLWMIRRGEPGNQRAPGSTPTLAVFRARLPLIGFNLAVLLVVSTVALALVPERVPLAWPGLWTVATQVLLLFLLEDASFYAWHRLLHQNRTLYRRIHRIHHQAWAPLPLEYIYVHPVEWMVGAAGPALGLVALASMPAGLSVWVLWIYTLLRQLHEINIHSTSRLAMTSGVPLIGTPEDHALHHAKPTLGGYASLFRIWDLLFRTRIAR